MNIKRSVSVILAAFCLTAGANIFTANAATVSPEGIAASENVGASKDDQIKDLKAQLADLENRYYYLQKEMADMETNYQHRLSMMEGDLMAAENRYSAARAEADEMETNLNKHIKSLQEENTALSSANSSLTKENSTLKTNNTSLTTQVDNLKKTVSEYKAQSEAANYKYEAFLNDIQRLDANGDNKIDATDASMLLSIYAYNSTNKTPVTTISDYYKKTS
ncbi:hypothetical protein [Ruminococcus flavefaciens]|uniref:hypothetical protein n=1 Tax=Ruminococcus flavefaciens TaxID=1265 RepID=UPI0026EF527E|nr:hypothetical protein [Ruminococcus flavefaciens]